MTSINVEEGINEEGGICCKMWREYSVHNYITGTSKEGGKIIKINKCRGRKCSWRVEKNPISISESPCSLVR